MHADETKLIHPVNLIPPNIPRCSMIFELVNEPKSPPMVNIAVEREYNPDVKLRQFGNPNKTDTETLVEVVHVRDGCGKFSSEMWYP